eukprot:1795188-Pleurochrysis_carterae.AAC.1
MVLAVVHDGKWYVLLRALSGAMWACNGMVGSDNPKAVIVITTRMLQETCLCRCLKEMLGEEINAIVRSNREGTKVIT